MAVQFESSETVTRGHSYWLATQDIDIDAENNGRHVLPDIAWLVDSIRRDGQKVPCLIRKNGKRATMIEGHSRWRAICEINKSRKPDERIKVWCVYFEGNEVDALLAGFVSNRERNALQPVDEGYFVARMQRFGKTLEEIAKLCHEDVKWCKERLAYVQLTPEAQELASKGELGPSAAVALAKLAAAEQRRYLKSGGKLTAAGIKRAGTVGTAGTAEGAKGAEGAGGTGGSAPNPGSGKGRPVRPSLPSLPAVRDHIRAVLESKIKDYPTEDLRRLCSVSAEAEAACEALCNWMLAVIDGKAGGGGGGGAGAGAGAGVGGGGK